MLQTLISPPVEPTEWNVAPHGQRQASPKGGIALTLHHLSQPGERFRKHTCTVQGLGGHGLHPRAEHLNRADDTGGGDASGRTGYKGGVVVVAMFPDGAVGAVAEIVVAGEVYDVGGDGH